MQTGYLFGNIFVNLILMRLADSEPS